MTVTMRLTISSYVAAVLQIEVQVMTEKVEEATASSASPALRDVVVLGNLAYMSRGER